MLASPHYARCVGSSNFHSTNIRYLFVGASTKKPYSSFYDSHPENQGYKLSMLSLRLASSSSRGVSALASNHVGTQDLSSTTNTTQQSSKLSDAAHQDNQMVSQSNQFARQLSISDIFHQAARMIKESKSAPLDSEAQLPTKPKRPGGPWILFVRERKDEVLSQKSKMSVAEMSVILSREWKQIDKSKYKQEYQRLHDEYMRSSSRLSYAAHRAYQMASQSNQFARQLSISDIPDPRTAKESKSAPLDFEAQLPTKPKRPGGPWTLFLRERKDEVLSQKSKMSVAEMSVILSREWKQIDKSKYKQEYQRLHDEYMRSFENYQKSLTAEQRDLSDLQRDLKRESDTAEMLRKIKPPVLPRNSANLYFHERSKQDDFKEMLKNKTAKKVFRHLFKEYREMPESAKKKYLDMAEEDKVRFLHEFLTWYGIVHKNLSKAGREQVNAMCDRLKALNYL